MDIERWPHQEYAVNETTRLILDGVKRICVTSPTGGGKSVIIRDLAAWSVRQGIGVVLFANRKLLIDQIVGSLKSDGVYHGTRAAGRDDSNGWELFQIASIQTEYSRLVKRKTWVPHKAGMILIDESHLQENPSAQKVYDEYLAAGCVKVGFTATPIGIGGGYDRLVQAGTTSELRACGALVPAVHHGCTEPDLKNIRRIPLGEDLTEAEDRKLIMVPGIHGRVIDHWRRLNPHGLPTIGFAPGVPESVGFAEAFEKAGIPAAHIDGDVVWIRGNEFPSTQETRNELLAMSRTGQVRVVWNRFVLREAVDMPWLRHGIMATVFGSLQSCLQSGGRLLRSCPVVDKRDVVVQDHGGNWWRHGSLNSDRHWRLTDTAKSLAAERNDRMTGEDGQPKEPEPFTCQGCGRVLVLKSILVATVATCPTCGHKMDFRRRSRPVIQADGELVEHPGDIFRPRPVERRPDSHKLWEKVYWRAKGSKNGMTFKQAEALFYFECGYYPPKDLPLMPSRPADWYMPVAKVSYQDLYPREK